LCPERGWEISLLFQAGNRENFTAFSREFVNTCSFALGMRPSYLAGFDGID